jgi:large subunit ribosomal protein L35
LKEYIPANLEIIMRKKKKNKKYKLKTHKGTAKRFRKTGSGKIMRTKGHQGHFRRRKSKRAKRQYKWMQEVKGRRYIWRINKLAPYL